MTIPLLQSVGVQRYGCFCGNWQRIEGVSKKLVEHWEAGRRVPSPMACRLLDAIQREPSAFIRRSVRKPTARRRAA